MGLFNRKKLEEQVTVSPVVESRNEEISFESGSGADVLTALIGKNKVTAEIAVQVPAVARCVDMIAGAVASLPIKLYRNDGENVEEITDDPRLRFLNGDTGDTLNADEMRRVWVRDYLIRGSAYGYIQTKNGVPEKIYYIPAKDVSVFRNDNDVIFKKYMFNVNGKNIRPYQMLKILRNSDGFGKGKGVISDNSLVLDTAYQLMKFKRNQVVKGGNKKGFLKSQGVMRQPVLEDIKKGWSKLYSNENTESYMILNGDIDFKEMSSTSVEMQLNESSVAADKEIMRLFGTTDGVLSEDTVKNAVMPVIDAFEAAFDSDLLLESEKGTYYFAFDTRELTRGDIAKRYNAYAVALQNNFMQLDEVRKLEDLPALDVNFIKLGLNDVLLNPETNMIYTPNTNAWANMGDSGVDISSEEAEGEKFHGEH